MFLPRHLPWCRIIQPRFNGPLLSFFKEEVTVVFSFSHICHPVLGQTPVSRFPLSSLLIVLSSETLPI